MSAALELADRGYEVTIKEKMEHSVGGKLATKPVEALGQTFYVEHGFHGKFIFLGIQPLYPLIIDSLCFSMVR